MRTTRRKRQQGGLEAQEMARKIRRVKLLLHARRGVMETEELLATARLVFPLSRRTLQAAPAVEGVREGNTTYSSNACIRTTASLYGAVLGRSRRHSFETDGVRRQDSKQSYPTCTLSMFDSFRPSSTQSRRLTAKWCPIGTTRFAWSEAVICFGRRGLSKRWKQ